jgi:hypothetical protein
LKAVVAGPRFSSTQTCGLGGLFNVFRTCDNQHRLWGSPYLGDLALQSRSRHPLCAIGGLRRCGSEHDGGDRATADKARSARDRCSRLSRRRLSTTLMATSADRLQSWRGPLPHPDPTPLRLRAGQPLHHTRLASLPQSNQYEDREAEEGDQVQALELHS